MRGSRPRRYRKRQPRFSPPRAESRELGEFLHRHDALIRDGVHAYPASFFDRKSIMPVLASHAIIPNDEPKFHWDPDGKVSPEARRIMSINTCNGCHAGETACDTGLHVRPRAAGQTAALSGFLRMDGQPHRIEDPAEPKVRLEQHEMKDRAAILAAFLDSKDRRRIRELQEILRDRLRRAH